MNDFIDKNDIDFLRKIAIICSETIASRNNDDYVVNKPQMEKFCKAVDFFQKFVADCNGELDPIRLEPKNEGGYLTAYAYVFDISGENARKLCEIISYTSAITIDALGNGKVCISLTVPNVYVEKRKGKYIV